MNQNVNKNITAKIQKYFNHCLHWTVNYPNLQNFLMLVSNIQVYKMFSSVFLRLKFELHIQLFMYKNISS